jgi:hypothetical protein
MDRRGLDFLARLGRALANDRGSRRDYARLFEDFLAYTGLPAPDQHLMRWFASPLVLADLAEALLVPYSEETRDLINRVNRWRRLSRRSSFFRVRELSPLGDYPNLELVTQRAWYLIRHGTPYLVTLNSRRQENRFGYESELSDWTRHETRLAAAISCGQWGRFTVYLGRVGADVPTRVAAHVVEPERLSFLIEHSELVRQAMARSQSNRYWDRESHRPYEFSDFRPFRKAARTFAYNFLISHPVLLRTASHYVKAAMLWRTEGLTEDALARLLFALEGCLLLFQEIDGGRTDRLDRKLLRQIFVKRYVNGDSLYDFIEEATGWGGTRARVVHPQLANVEGWIPQLMADDYYEYAEVVRALLTFLVTSESHENYEMNP